MDQIKPLKEIRKEYVQQVLRSAQGDLDQASKILGITTVTLRRIIKEYGLSIEETDHNSEA